MPVTRILIFFMRLICVLLGVVPERYTLERKKILITALVNLTQDRSSGVLKKMLICEQHTPEQKKILNTALLNVTQERGLNFMQ
jgi:hypothetical protein